MKGFETGHILVTQGIADKMKEDEFFCKFLYNSLYSYMRCEWGDTCEEDAKSNDYAVKNDERILAVYIYNDKLRIWIITEYDRSATTILFPEEY